MSTSIGEAVLTIGIDEGPMQKGMKGIGASLKKHSKAIGLGMTAVGGTILAVGVTSIKAFADMGDEVHKMSLRTGIATESLSRLKYAAELGGASLSTVEKGVKKMSSTLADAKDGMATTVDAMTALGLTVEEFDGLNPEEAFMKMAGAVAAIEDPLMRSALAQDVFGKAGTELLPMLSEGTEGLQAMMSEAEKFAVIMDKDAAEAAAKLTDQMSQLKGGFQKIQGTIAEQLIPILIPLIDKIVLAISNVSAWMKANPELTKTIITIVGVIGGLLAVLGPLVLMLPTIASALPILGAAFSVLLGPVGLVILAVGAVVAAAIALKNNWEVIWRGIKRVAETMINFIIDRVNSLIRVINLIPGVNIGEIGKVGTQTQALSDRTKEIMAANPDRFAGGGLITEPTMLSSLRTGRAYGIAGESGVETITPGAGAGVTNNFEIAQLVVREEADVERIARELFTMQKARLRGVGA